MTLNPQLAAWSLQGQTVGDGWMVGERLANPRLAADGLPPEKSGSTFSVGYHVKKGNQLAFLKVFDIVSAFREGADLVGELNQITNAYNHEKAILNLCTSDRMSRVVRILAHGDIPVPFPTAIAPGFTISLHYIIFERADGGDIRDVFTQFDQITDALRFEYLHHVAVGIQQLHGALISHQDIKPSNVVVFNGNGAKITDFGRALKRGAPVPAHVGNRIAGDMLYAPPEQLYDHFAPDWREQREACDLFQLGSLAAFMFSGKNATAGIIEALSPEARPGTWAGSYEDILPVVQRAFADFMASIKPSFPTWAAADIERFITLTCEPDVYKRGDPRARAQTGKPLGVDRFISHLSRLYAESKRRFMMAKATVGSQ